MTHPVPLKPCSRLCFTVVVYTVTSRSATMRWPPYPGASHYRVQATPQLGQGHSGFSTFNGDTVVGGLNTLAPNTVYVMQVDAMDDDFNVLSTVGTAEALTGQLTPRTPDARRGLPPLPGSFRGVDRHAPFFGGGLDCKKLSNV